MNTPKADIENNMDIDKILLKVLNNQAKSEEYAALEGWKKESEANIKLLQELKENAEKGMQGYKDYDKNSAWHKMETRMIREEAQPATKSRALPLVLVAACIGLLIGGIYLFTDKTPEIPTEHIATAENLQFALADESNIWLRNGGSILNVISDFSQERKVSLNGEAYFDITKDTVKPFIIELENNEYVKVVGTSFNLLSEGNDLTIYSGVVELHTSDRSSPLTLTKGDRVTRVKNSLVLIENTDENLLSWKSDELIFDDVDMGTALKAIAAHFNYEIDLSDPSVDLSNCRVHTKFINETLPQIMKELVRSHNFEFQNTAGKLIVKNLSCK